MCSASNEKQIEMKIPPVAFRILAPFVLLLAIAVVGNAKVEMPYRSKWATAFSFAIATVLFIAAFIISYIGYLN